MNPGDVNDTIVRWLDAGADRAPERFVWAALERVETTPQPGARLVSLERMTMPMKLAASLAAAALIVVAAVVVYQMINPSFVGDDADARRLNADDIAAIVVNAANVPDGLVVGRELRGDDAFRNAPGPDGNPRSVPDEVIDGRLTDIHVIGAGDDGTVWYASVATLYATHEDAERAFQAQMTEYATAPPGGWGLTPDDDLGLGDGSASYTGMLYGEAEGRVFAWRMANALFFALGFADYDPATLEFIARAMDARARSAGEADPSPEAGAQEPAGVVALDEPNLPEGVREQISLRGREAVQEVDLNLAGALDAALIEFDFDDIYPIDRYQSFAALYASSADAEAAFDAATAHLESADGWGLAMTPRANYDPRPPLGDESAHYLHGLDLGYPELDVYVWRNDKLVLFAADFHPYNRPKFIGFVASEMDARAR